MRTFQMKKISILLAALAVLGVGAWYTLGRGGVTPNYADLAYSDASSRNVLDVYLPENVENPPVVLYTHGGGFVVGDKSDPSLLSDLLAAGYAVVSMNYRLSSEAAYPAQIDDLRAAITFVRANQGEWGVDASRMASFGASAGGYLATMAGIALSADPETRLQASVDWFGPILFNEMDADMAEVGLEPKMGVTNSADSAEAKLLAVDLSQNPEAAIEASPITWISKVDAANIPPFLIQHGDQDTNISWKQSERLQKALEAAGVSAEFEVFPGTSHGGGTFDDASTSAKVIAFLDANLK